MVRFLVGAACGLAFAAGVWMHDRKMLNTSFQPDPTHVVELVGQVDGYCSGTLYGAGLVLTAAHCFDDGLPPLVLRDGKRHPTSVLWANREYDVAMLLVDGLSAPTVSFSCLDPRVGDVVVTAGYSAITDLNHYFFWGRVAGPAERRGEPGKVDKDDKPIPSWPWSMVVDVITIPGQSGSGVWSMGGKVVGIIVGGWKTTNPGIIVPGSTICTLMEQNRKDQ